MILEVEAPDDDAVATFREVERLVGEGQRVLILRRPAVPLEWMPVIAARCVALCQAYEQQAPVAGN